MSRKRIVWCRDRTGTVEALTTFYFGTGQHQLVCSSSVEDLMGLPSTPLDAYFSDHHLPSVNLANDFSLAQNGSTNFCFQ
ncbi:hypothetical protein [Tunicatimonas pelagia]|uniref:hypothetical protein n=1 Tax=Tunicatimonas pelagia TaxID=931531 RepID=UPI002666FEA2|nr:hypothetical protein [Tunicatimonas pelagia]WKN46413.1 hypothetical protein P0M28_30655 [Tunicatimonas pelagia]